MSTISVPCITITQNDKQLVCFSMESKQLYSIVEINQRDSDKDQGYQRVLSKSRVKAITTYVEQGNIIPISILIALGDDSVVSEDGKTINIPNRSDAGWVIDGQHRLAGAQNSQVNIELCVVAIIGASIEEQVQQFVTINKEAKGVPTSLYYDLRKHLPPKQSPNDRAKDRAADIASALKKDEKSPFYARIVISAPKRGEISLNNFVRKVSPLLLESKGPFEAFNFIEQKGIIDNYFKALKQTFPSQFRQTNMLFFKTLGFGAMINSLSTIFNYTIKYYGTFVVADIVQILQNIDYFDFDKWNNYGSGSAAEIQAGEDIREELRSIFEQQGDQTTLKL